MAQVTRFGGHPKGATEGEVTFALDWVNVERRKRNGERETASVFLGYAERAKLALGLIGSLPSGSYTLRRLSGEEAGSLLDLLERLAGDATK